MLIGISYVAYKVGQILVNMVYVIGLLVYIVFSAAVMICIGMERNHFCGELIGTCGFFISQWLDSVGCAFICFLGPVASFGLQGIIDCM